MRAVGKQQRKIALDRRETRDGLEAARVFDAVVRAVERAEIQLGEKNVLAKFEALGDAARKLAGDSQRLGVEKNSSAMRGI